MKFAGTDIELQLWHGVRWVPMSRNKSGSWLLGAEGADSSAKRDDWRDTHDTQTYANDFSALGAHISNDDRSFSILMGSLINDQQLIARILGDNGQVKWTGNIIVRSMNRVGDMNGSEQWMVTMAPGDIAVSPAMHGAIITGYTDVSGQLGIAINMIGAINAVNLVVSGSMRGDGARMIGSVITSPTVVSGEVGNRDRCKGLWTIGNTASADYWDWEEFVDLFPGTLSGDLTVTQVADIVMEDAVSVVPNLNGYKFTVTSDTPHVGNPSVGWKIVQEDADHRKLEFWTGGDDVGGTLEIKNLQFFHTVNWTTLHEGISVVSGTDSANCTILVHDLLIISTDNASKYQISIRALGLSSCTFKVWNLVLIDTHLSCQRDDPTSGGGSGVCLVENITHIMDATFAHTKAMETDWWLAHPGTTGNQWKFRSIFSTYGLIKDWAETPDIDYVCYDVLGSTTFAVHEWNITGHDSAMLSVDPASADFADIKPAGEFVDCGVPLISKLITENTTCIRGRVRQPDNGAASHSL